MLANKARADVSEALQARAEFMIAESYHAEAMSILPVEASASREPEPVGDEQ